jgi:hypothetical protein
MAGHAPADDPQAMLRSECSRVDRDFRKKRKVTSQSTNDAGSEIGEPNKRSKAELARSDAGTPLGHFRVVGCRAFHLDFAEGLGGETEERCVADEAVKREPVSGAEFPVIREFNREFSRIWGVCGRFSRLIRPEIQSVVCKFPVRKNREFEMQ